MPSCSFTVNHQKVVRKEQICMETTWSEFEINLFCTISHKTGILVLPQPCHLINCLSASNDPKTFEFQLYLCVFLFSDIYKYVLYLILKLECTKIIASFLITPYMMYGNILTSDTFVVLDKVYSLKALAYNSKIRM